MSFFARTLADVDADEDAELRRLERGVADDDANGPLFEAAALLDGTRGVVRLHPDHLERISDGTAAASVQLEVAHVASVQQSAAGTADPAGSLLMCVKELFDNALVCGTCAAFTASRTCSGKRRQARTSMMAAVSNKAAGKVPVATNSVVTRHRRRHATAASSDFLRSLRGRAIRRVCRQY